LGLKPIRHRPSAWMGENNLLPALRRVRQAQSFPLVMRPLSRPPWSGAVHQPA
jgi:hypothetical protein